MKKFFFIAAAMAAAFVASCDKNPEIYAETTRPDVPVQGSQVCIVLAEEPCTRAFFDSTAAAETWEKTLSALSVFVFDASGNLILRRDFTSPELTAKSATFALPKSAAGTTCSFYAVANCDVTTAKSKPTLMALTENAAAVYNGTFTEVSTKALRAGGFVMSGMKDQAVGAVNTSTSVAITLKRTVAKIALQATLDPSFAQKYGGTLTVNSVKLSRAAAQALVIASSAPATGAMTFIHTQTPAAASGKYNALFYCYENGALAAGARVLVEVNATYDQDGNASTTADRSEVTYAVELTGKASGEILRNGYYRIAVNITGLVGQDCEVAVTVAEWETPATQSISLGA